MDFSNYYATLRAEVKLDPSAVQKYGAQLSDNGIGCKWGFESNYGGTCTVLTGIGPNPKTWIEGNSTLISEVQVYCDRADKYIAHFAATDGAVPVFRNIEFTPILRQNGEESDGGPREVDIPDEIIDGTSLNIAYGDGELFQGMQIVLMSDNTGSMDGVLQNSIAYVNDIMQKLMQIAPTRNIQYAVMGYGAGTSLSRIYNKYNQITNKKNPPCNDQSPGAGYALYDFWTKNGGSPNCPFLWNNFANRENPVPTINEVWEKQRVQGGNYSWNATKTYGYCFFNEADIDTTDVKTYKSGYKESYKYDTGDLPMIEVDESFNGDKFDEVDFLDNKNATFYRTPINQGNTKRGKYSKFYRFDPTKPLDDPIQEYPDPEKSLIGKYIKKGWMIAKDIQTDMGGANAFNRPYFILSAHPVFRQNKIWYTQTKPSGGKIQNIGYTKTNVNNGKIVGYRYEYGWIHTSLHCTKASCWMYPAGTSKNANPLYAYNLDTDQLLTNTSLTNADKELHKKITGLSIAPTSFPHPHPEVLHKLLNNIPESLLTQGLGSLGISYNYKADQSNLTNTEKKALANGITIVGKSAKTRLDPFNPDGTENAVATIWEAAVGFKWDPRKLHIIVNIGDEPPYEYGWANRFHVNVKKRTSGCMIKDGSCVKLPKRVSMLEAVEMLDERKIHLCYVATGTTYNDKNFWGAKCMERLMSTKSAAFSLTTNEVSLIVSFIISLINEIKALKFTLRPVDGLYDLNEYPDLIRVIKKAMINGNDVWKLKNNMALSIENMISYADMKPNKRNIAEIEVCSSAELAVLRNQFGDKIPPAGTYQIPFIVENEEGIGFQGATDIDYGNIQNKHKQGLKVFTVKIG